MTYPRKALGEAFETHDAKKIPITVFAQRKEGRMKQVRSCAQSVEDEGAAGARLGFLGQPDLRALTSGLGRKLEAASHWSVVGESDSRSGW